MLFQRDGVKLLDFGIAKLETSDLTATGEFLGTLSYRTICQVLYEEPPRPSSLRPGIPLGWDRVPGRLLAKIPEARYPTAGDFLTDLDR